VLGAVTTHKGESNLHLISNTFSGIVLLNKAALPPEGEYSARYIFYLFL
jgi:hypothetical protein